LRTVAADAAVQEPFLLHDLRGGNNTNVGWAILLPRPSFARGGYATCLMILPTLSKISPI
jgi:hypothetical protein